MKQVAAVLTMMIVLMFGFAILLQAQGHAPGVVILKGNPMGGVKFDHAAHAKAATDKCEACHHASKPEKPEKVAQQRCQDCHTQKATAPMKTATKFAFHDASAKKGTCIDCHMQKPAVDKKAPLKCAECHKKENVH